MTLYSLNAKFTLPTMFHIRELEMFYYETNLKTTLSRGGLDVTLAKSVTCYIILPKDKVVNETLNTQQHEHPQWKLLRSPKQQY